MRLRTADPHAPGLRRKRCGRGFRGGPDPLGGTEPLRVLLADDQTRVRTGFRMILGADGIGVVAEATNGTEAVAAARRTRSMVTNPITVPLSATRARPGFGQAVIGCPSDRR